MKKLLLLALCVVINIFVSGCGGESDKTTGGKTKGDGVSYRISFHAPAEYINGVEKNASITESLAFVEIRSRDRIIARTEGQGIGGYKSDFHFDIKGKISPDVFPVNVVFCIGEKKEVERAYRAAVGGTAGAGVGALIGGVSAGVCSGGLGAPAGAAIGAFVGGLIGGGAGALSPIKHSKEIASFYIESSSGFVGEHRKRSEDKFLHDEDISIIIKRN